MLHRTRLVEAVKRRKQLRERVARSLSQSPFPMLRKVRFHINGSTVTLWGRVPTELLKTAAERCVLKVPDVDFVYNRLQVGGPVVDRIRQIDASAA